MKITTNGTSPDGKKPRIISIESNAENIAVQISNPEGTSGWDILLTPTEFTRLILAAQALTHDSEES